MSTEFADDFSSYSVGAGVSPPWEDIGLGSNIIAGGFRGQGLRYQPGGGIRRNTAGNYYNDLTLYFYFRFPNGIYNGNILEFLNGPITTAGSSISLFKLGVEPDGSVSLSTHGAILDNSGNNLGYALFSDKWYFVQANVKFDVNVGGFVTIDATVAFDGFTILDSGGPQATDQLVSGLSSGSATVNKFDFRDVTTNSIIDEIIANTPRDAIVTYPNPGATVHSRVTQAILEHADLVDDSNVRITQGIIEHAILPDNQKIRITQMIIEIATANVISTGNGWHVKEA